MSVYAGADRIIREMNRANLKAFNLLKLARFDELNLIKRVANIYDASVRLARKKYLMIAHDAYITAMIECGIGERRATDMAYEDITADWVLDMLEETDPVTLYAFLPETDRKKERLTEALAVAQNRNSEIDRALKAWTGQVAQYADNTVHNARLEAFIAAGIRRVQWQDMEDDRVCKECHDLNGQTYDIHHVPPRPHWGCRCVLLPVLD